MKNINYYIICIALVVAFLVGRNTKHCTIIDTSPVIYADTAHLRQLHNTIDGLLIVSDSLEEVILFEKQKRINTRLYYEKIINSIDTTNQSELRLFFTDRYGE